MPLHTVAGLFCACATRSIIAGDPSAIHVFMSHHRSRNVVWKMWQEGHTHNTCRAGKMTINVAASRSILGCFVPGVLFFAASRMERHACFSIVGGTSEIIVCICSVACTQSPGFHCKDPRRLHCSNVCGDASSPSLRCSYSCTCTMSYLRGRMDTHGHISSTRRYLMQPPIACGTSILHSNR